MNFTGRLIEKRESRGNMEFKVGEIIKMKKKQEERLPRKRKLVRMQSHQSKKRLQLMSLIK